MTETYINQHFPQIKRFASIIENRLDDTYCTIESVRQENTHNLAMCKKNGCNYILITDNYNIDLDLF